MCSGTCGLTTGIETWNGTSTVEIDANTTRCVMRCWCDRDQVLRWIDAMLQTRARDGGEAFVEIRDAASIEEDMVDLVLSHLPFDLLRHHISRREICEWVRAFHESLT